MKSLSVLLIIVVAVKSSVGLVISKMVNIVKTVRGVWYAVFVMGMVDAPSALQGLAQLMVSAKCAMERHTVQMEARVFLFQIAEKERQDRQVPPV